MPALREFIAGPWRAVLVLGVTQILTWGTLFYPPVLTVPLIAADRGWSVTFGMGGFSLALLTAGLVSPRIGFLIDRYGGHRVMPAGSLLAALGLFCLVHAAHPARLSGDLDAAWRRDRGLAVRSGLRHARPHLRRGRAPPDHRADARRRLRLDRELAGDASPDRRRRLARHLPRLCGAARFGRGAAARLRAAAHARRAAAEAPGRAGGSAQHRAAGVGLAVHPGGGGVRRPTRSCPPACRRICSRSSAAPASTPRRW